MTFEGIFSGESFSTSSVAAERLVSRVSFSMTFEVVLTIEGQIAHIAREWSDGC